MNYLARLKQLETGEIFHHVPKHEPTKPTKGGSDGFVGSTPGVNENIYTVCAEFETTSFRWLVHFSDREPVEVYCHPDESWDGIMATYPDALAAEPIPERTKARATPEQEAELRARMIQIGDRAGKDGRD